MQLDDVRRIALPLHLQADSHVLLILGLHEIRIRGAALGLLGGVRLVVHHPDLHRHVVRKNLLGEAGKQEVGLRGQWFGDDAVRPRLLHSVFVAVDGGDFKQDGGRDERADGEHEG